MGKYIPGYNSTIQGFMLWTLWEMICMAIEVIVTHVGFSIVSIIPAKFGFYGILYLSEFYRNPLYGIPLDTPLQHQL